MTPASPTLSVIIPTHNRRASVCRTLEALASQTLSPDRFEVIVIADGCVDDTVVTLGKLTLPYRLTILEQAGLGQGKARNLGAEAAKGAVLVFLDDDIVPVPGALEAYERCHRVHPRSLVLGPAIPVLSEEKSFFSHGLRNWWYDHLRALTSSSHRFSYRDMHSGNFSLSALLFAENGGFDPEFFRRSGEDYEFGIRLLARGVPFVVEPEASAFHHDATDLDRSLLRVRMEGRADVLMGLRHPELRNETQLRYFRSPRSRAGRLLRHLAFRHPAIGDYVAGLLRALLTPLERLKIRKSWQQVHGALRSYWYCRGAAFELDASAGGMTLERFLGEVPVRTSALTVVDLEPGLDASVERIDAIRPGGVRIELHGMPVATIPDTPGAEPVKGCHLRDFLARNATQDLLVAAAAHRIGRSESGWAG